METEGAYKTKPNNGARKVKGKGKKEDSDEDYEDTSYSYKAQIKKPKPQPVASKEVSAEVLKKREEQKKKNAEKAAEKRLKEAKKTMKEKLVPIADEQIVEVDETRDPASLVFIGHVDAGKSTISGNLMYLYGVVD